MDGLARTKGELIDVTKKLTAFREQEGRSPSNKEIAELALPQREWLDDGVGANIGMNLAVKLLRNSSTNV